MSWWGSRYPIQMRIAQVAPLAESVPPKPYGGTERVIAWLIDELVGLGHDVTLLASGDSQTRARLLPPLAAPVATRPTAGGPCGRVCGAARGGGAARVSNRSRFSHSSPTVRGRAKSRRDAAALCAGSGCRSVRRGTMGVREGTAAKAIR
jgi:hypothetical protein